MQISGVPSIMMEKSALAGEGGGCTPGPPSFTLFTVMYKVVVYAPAKRADTLPPPYFISTLYVFCGAGHGNQKEKQHGARASKKGIEKKEIVRGTGIKIGA